MSQQLTVTLAELKRVGWRHRVETERLHVEDDPETGAPVYKELTYLVVDVPGGIRVMSQRVGALVIDYGHGLNQAVVDQLDHHKVTYSRE